MDTRILPGSETPYTTLIRGCLTVIFNDTCELQRIRYILPPDTASEKVNRENEIKKIKELEAICKQSVYRDCNEHIKPENIGIEYEEHDEEITRIGLI